MMRLLVVLGQTYCSICSCPIRRPLPKPSCSGVQLVPPHSFNPDQQSSGDTPRTERPPFTRALHREMINTRLCDAVRFEFLSLVKPAKQMKIEGWGQSSGKLHEPLKTRCKIEERRVQRSGCEGVSASTYN